MEWTVELHFWALDFVDIGGVTKEIEMALFMMDGSSDQRTEAENNKAEIWAKKGDKYRLCLFLENLEQNLCQILGNTMLKIKLFKTPLFVENVDIFRTTALHDSLRLKVNSPLASDINR